MCRARIMLPGRESIALGDSDATQPHHGPMSESPEAPAGWAEIPVSLVAHRVRALAMTLARPCIVAIDGRSGAGKSTVAGQLAVALDDAPVVHTDDVAWHHSFFDWWPLLRGHVLEPVRGDLPVSWRPDAWVARARAGSIRVPGRDAADTEARAPRVVIVEGVSACRLELADLLDVCIWVTGDRTEQERRGLARDGEDDDARRFWDAWQASEVPLLDADRPWERADLSILGTPVVAPPPGTWMARPGAGGRLKL